MKGKKLPEAVKQYLSERQITPEDVVIAVFADREEGAPHPSPLAKPAFHFQEPTAGKDSRT